MYVATYVPIDDFVLFTHHLFFINLLNILFSLSNITITTHEYYDLKVIDKIQINLHKNLSFIIINAP